jgi:hypothetical protein
MLTNQACPEFQFFRHFTLAAERPPFQQGGLICKSLNILRQLLGQTPLVGVWIPQRFSRIRVHGIGIAIN